MKRTIISVSFLIAASAAIPASAGWTISKEGVPSDCSHVITDGNWKIGVYRNSDDNWNLCKRSGVNGNAYIAGEGVLDLRNITEETKCEEFPSGVILKTSNNGALEGGKPITEVWFPDSFETMDGNTFKYDTKLEKVVFGSGFKTVGLQSFEGCTGLKSVSFNSGIETIAYNGFRNCSALELEDFTFPESLTTLGDHCFAGCKKIIGTLTFPGVTTLTGEFQFEDCVGITSFVAPNCTMTAKLMFNRCTSLSSATFSPNIETIVQSSFENSPTLLSFSPTSMPKLKTFGQCAFRGQRKLVADFDFSNSEITELPYYAFVDDENVGNIKLPECLAKIGGAALGYGKKSRVVWFCGPPPAMDSDALNPKGGKSWILVGGVKHAAEWRADEHVAQFSGNEKEQAIAAATEFGLKGVKPIGKWTYQTGGYKHWVFEELPTATVLIIL